MTYRLVQGDCLEVLPTLPNESVDLIFADPPFNVGIGYKGYTDNRADYYEWCAAWIAEGFRVLKPSGTFYLMTITRHLESLYPMMKMYGVFVNQVNWKNVASTNNGRSFWNEYQPILVYGKTDDYKFYRLAQTRKTLMSWNVERRENVRGQLLDHWEDIPYVYGGSIHHKEAVLISGTNRKAHPAQMPVALPRRAIVFSTDEGDTVLDPFSGSFSTAIACLETNRNFIGIEQSADYVKLGYERINRFNSQPSIFQQAVSTPPNTDLQWIGANDAPTTEADQLEGMPMDIFNQMVESVRRRGFHSVSSAAGTALHPLVAVQSWRLLEEAGEVARALRQGEHDAATMELADVVIAAVNLAYQLGVDPIRFQTIIRDKLSMDEKRGFLHNG